jgi:hypothetical protein
MGWDGNGSFEFVARCVAICCRYGYGYLMFSVARERYRGSIFLSRVI